MIIGWDDRIGNRYLIGILDRIIGLDYWMVFFQPNSDVSRPAGAFLAGAFLFFLRHIIQNCHIWSTNVISGPDFLKNDDICSDLII